MKLRPAVGPIFAILLAFYSPTAAAQQPGSPPSVKPQPAPPGQRSTITLRVLSGDGALNSLAMRTAVIPAVEVLDYLGNPIEGAEVVFMAPESGPGGVFPGGVTKLTTRSDARGQAVADFTPNTLPGGFVIRVEASFLDMKASTAIRQTNDPKTLIAGPEPKPKPWYADWRWWAAIGGGAGGGTWAYLATRDSSSTSSIPTITLSPGAIAVGGPR